MTRTERTYYLIFGLHSFSWSFLGPVYALFLLSRGLDLFQINVVLAVYLITSFVVAAPMGAIADVFGRKASFVLSCLVRMGAFILYAFSYTFTAFLVAEFIDAVGSMVTTSALDAWAVDGMRSEGHRKPVDRFFARAQMLARCLMIVSGLVAAYLAGWSLDLPWLVAAAGFALTATAGAILMHEPARDRQQSGAARDSVVAVVSIGFRTVRGNPVLTLLCALTALTAFAAMPVYNLWQPRMQALASEGVWLMGWIWALLNLSSIVGSALIPRMLGHLRRDSVLVAAALWRAVNVGIAAWAAGFFPAVSGLLLQELGFGLGEPLMQAWVNEHADEKQRATVLSVRAMAFTLGGAAGLVCLGLLARARGIPAAWLVSALVFALSAPLCMILGRLARRARETSAATEKMSAIAPAVPPTFG